MSFQHHDPSLFSQIRLKEATPEDQSFAKQLILDNMATYIQQSGYQWNDSEFEQGWALTANIIVVRDTTKQQEEKIGLIRLHLSDERAILWEFQLIKSCQNQGLGKSLLELMIRSNAGRKEFVLEVYRNNPAVNLYEQAGFKIRYETEYLLGMFLPLPEKAV
jgi:ribosomal protein S18 acetylase RimI-like enzyme